MHLFIFFKMHWEKLTLITVYLKTLFLEKKKRQKDK